MKKRRLGINRWAAAACAAAALIAVAPASLRAGWIVEEVDGDFPDSRRTYLFQDGRVRVEGVLEGVVFLLNVEGREGFLVDERAGRYAGGTVGEILTALRRRQERSLDGKQGGEERPAVVLSPARIERGPGDESIAGFAADHYRVMLDEELVEELWIAPALGVLPGGKSGSVGDLLEAMTGGGVDESGEFPPGYEEEPAYRELLRAGYPVRRIRYYVGEKSTTEVRRAREKDLPDGIFLIPAGMEKMSYPALFFGEE